VGIGKYSSVNLQLVLLLLLLISDQPGMDQTVDRGYH